MYIRFFFFLSILILSFFFFFFFNDTATTEIYTLSLHDALPISPRSACCSLPSSTYGSDGSRSCAQSSTTAASGAASSAAGTRRDAACSSQSRGARRHPRCRGGLRPPAHAVPGAAGAGPHARARRGRRRYDRRRHGPRGGFLFEGALLREGVGRGGGR